MAEKKNKTYYYILVFTPEGPKYVTGISGRSAMWDHNEKPEEFSKSRAYDIATGLTWNGYSAVVVASNYEIERQPYRYDCYEIQWKEKDKEDKE